MANLYSTQSMNLLTVANKGNARLPPGGPAPRVSGRAAPVASRAGKARAAHGQGARGAGDGADGAGRPPHRVQLAEASIHGQLGAGVLAGQPGLVAGVCPRPGP